MTIGSCREALSQLESHVLRGRKVFAVLICLESVQTWQLLSIIEKREVSIPGSPSLEKIPAHSIPPQVTFSVAERIKTWGFGKKCSLWLKVTENH